MRERLSLDRKATQAAIDLFVEEIGVTKDDAAEFTKSVHEISKDTPAAQVSANRVVRLLGKVGPGVAKAIRDILVGVAAEAVKKTIR
jgi:hypothetical protein